MTAIASIAAHRKLGHAEDQGEKKKLWGTLLLLSAATAFLMIRPSAIFWEYLPKLRFVQFPWRWMAILAGPYAYFLAAATWSQRKRLIWVLLALVAARGTGTRLVHNAWWSSEDVPVLLNAIANDRGFE